MVPSIPSPGMFRDSLLHCKPQKLTKLLLSRQRYPSCPGANLCWQLARLSAKKFSSSSCGRNNHAPCRRQAVIRRGNRSHNSAFLADRFPHALVIFSMSWEGTMKFRPLHDRVVVRRIDAEEKSAGGIIIPDTAKEKPSQGEVIAVGPGGRDESGKLIPIDVKVGDRVLFGKWSGTEVKIDGRELLIMKESDIMGVLVEAKGHKMAA